MYVSVWLVPLLSNRGVHDRDHMIVGPMQSVPTTTNVVGLNSAHGDVYSIQHYMIKFVSDLQQVSGFLQVVRFLHQLS